MIPKIIHYCWFSGDKKPALIKKCIHSWKKHLPDYDIRCWNGNSFDFDSLDFTREAMAVKQYAAASDYVRLYALYNYGGIYLDSDVEVFRSFDDLLNNVFFSGYEFFDKYEIEAGILGSIKGLPYIKECMSYFENRHFIHNNGKYDNVKNHAPGIITRYAFNHGYEPTGLEQITPDGLHIYPRTIFANEGYSAKTFGVNFEIDTTNLIALHHNMGGWTTIQSRRGRFWKFCWEHNLLDTYKAIENFRVRFTKRKKQ